MRLVIRRELRSTWRSWTATGVAIALATAICALAWSARSGLTGLDPAEQDSVESYGTALVAFTLLATFAVVGLTVDLAVATMRRGLALVQLAGLAPGQAMRLVYAQVAIIALPAVGLGAGLSVVLAPPATTLVVYGATETSLPDGGRASAGPILAAGLLVLTIAVLAASRGARQARDVRPMEALRAVEPPPARRSRLRRMTTVASTILLALSTATAVLGPIAIDAIPTTTGTNVQEWTSGPDTVLSSAVFACLALTGLLASTAPRYCPALLRAWTGIVPRSAFPTWHLARRLAGEHLSRATAAVTLIMIATTLTGGLYTVFATGAAALGTQAGPDASARVNHASIIPLLAGPFLLALVGAALTLVVTQRERMHELALIQVAGATPRQLLAIPLIEVAMYAATAALLALLACLAIAAIVAAGFLTQTPVLPQVAPLPILLIPTLAALLLAAAILPTLLRDHHHPTARRLTTE